MVNAKTREEFVKAWSCEFDVMAMLSESLPTKGPGGANVALTYLQKLRELRSYIEIAANDTYADQDLKDYFKECVGRGISQEELAQAKLYISNEERDHSDPIVRKQAVDYLIKNWRLLERARAQGQAPDPASDPTLF